MDKATLASPVVAAKSNMPNERGWAQMTTESSPAAGGTNISSRPFGPALLRTGHGSGARGRCE
jgi:hypothetical protein